MDRYSTRDRVVGGVLGIISIVLSSFAITQIKRLYLPIPLALAIFNLVIPILAIGTVLILSKVAKTTFAPTLTAITSAVTLIPFVLLILSLVYATPSDLLACTIERRWLHYFRTHSVAIQRIQDRLQCCGLNSLHDRAWPFPSHDVDARACERMLHYGIRCAEVWLREESRTAGMIGFASFINWILLILLLTNRRDSAWFGIPGTAPVQQRLLGEPQRPQNAIEEAAYEDEPRR